MTYSIGTIAKALVAFGVATIGAATTAAGGPDLSHLDFGSWFAALAVGLTAAGGVFVTPNKPHESAADQVINNIPVVVQNASDALSELDRVKQAASDALAQVPVLGPLAQAAINSIPKI